MKLKKAFALIGCTALVGMLAAGCGTASSSSGSSGGTSASSSGETSSEKTSDSDTVYGKVTKVDGSTITIQVAKLNKPKDAPNGAKEGSSDSSNSSGSGSSSNSSSSDSGSSSDNSSSGSGSSSDSSSSDTGKSGKNTDGKAPGTMDPSDMVTLSDETMKVTVDDSVDISDIAKGDYVTITMDGNDVKSVKEGIQMEKPSGKAPAAPDSGNSSGSSSDSSGS